MAEEPQPDPIPPQPTAAEKKSEAAALSNLSTNDEDTEPAKQNTQDTAALGAAFSNLSVSDSKAGDDKVKAPEVKKVKIEAADVTFLVEELDVSKKKATDMLQASLGDRMAAVRTFVLPALKA